MLFRAGLTVILTAVLLLTPGNAAGTDDGVPYRTQLGAHNASLPHAGRLGVRVVRMIVKDQSLEKILERKGKAAENLRRAREAGIEFVVTTRWPAGFPSAREAIEAGGTRRDSHLDRIPQGQEREEALDQLERFLIAADGLISWYQIQNEVFGGPGYYTEEQFRNGEAYVWLEAVARRARETIDRENLKIKIISPAFHAPPVTDSFISQANDRLLTIMAPYCDAVDIHLHRSDFEDLTGKIRAMQARMKRLGINLPLVTLEWSQAGALRGRLRDPAIRNFLRNAYQEPVTAETWADFIFSLDLEPDYLRRSYEFMNREGFLIACWAPMSQYGGFESPVRYDITALRANRTVGPRALNEPFATQYRDIASRIQPQKNN